MPADDAALIIEDGGQPLVIALLDRVGRAVTVSGAYLGADHAWQLSAPHEKAGLPVGADRRRERSLDRPGSKRVGGPVGLDERAPSMVGDEQFRQWWARLLRMSASPAAVTALNRMNAD
jgi:hypothetical protein